MIYTWFVEIGILYTIVIRHCKVIKLEATGQEYNKHYDSGSNIYQQNEILVLALSFMLQVIMTSKLNWFIINPILNDMYNKVADGMSIFLALGLYGFTSLLFILLPVCIFYYEVKILLSTIRKDMYLSTLVTHTHYNRVCYYDFFLLVLLCVQPVVGYLVVPLIQYI